MSWSDEGWRRAALEYRRALMFERPWVTKAEFKKWKAESNAPHRRGCACWRCLERTHWFFARRAAVLSSGG